MYKGGDIVSLPSILRLYKYAKLSGFFCNHFFFSFGWVGARLGVVVYRRARGREDKEKKGKGEERLVMDFIRYY